MSDNIPTEPRCYHCQTLLPDINAACPNCLPNFYSRQTQPRQAPPSSNLVTDLRAGIRDAEDELKSYGPRAGISVSAGWLKTTLELALAAIAPGPVQTEVCPVCRTVHDKPLCPAPETSCEPSNEHVSRLRTIADWMAGRLGSKYTRTSEDVHADVAAIEWAAKRLSPDVSCSCGHHERYHFDDGRGAIVCRYADDCGCSRPAPPRT